MSQDRLTAVKAPLKRAWRDVRTATIRRFFSFGVADLRQALLAVGIRRSDTVMVHSSWTAFEGFTGKPTDAIAVLQDVVGPDGTILMPTMPFAGRAVDYAHSEPVFDLRRTPSKMGMLSEIFRRSPGVERSIHPTHPVAAWGRGATDMLAEHYRAGTPCGNPSPFAALAHGDGKILLIGTGIGVLTFYHYVEELLESRFAQSPFTTEIFSLHTRLADGSIVETRTRLFDPELSRRRNLGVLVEPLQRHGAWRQTKVGQLSLIVLNAMDVVHVVTELADRGIDCYAQ